MADFKRKNRTITLRISEQEYQALKSAYTTNGLRSLSEMARTAMQGAIGIGDGSSNLESRLNTLDGQVADLRLAVARLTRQVEEGMFVTKRRQES